MNLSDFLADNATPETKTYRQRRLDSGFAELLVYLKPDAARALDHLRREWYGLSKTAIVEQAILDAAGRLGMEDGDEVPPKYVRGASALPASLASRKSFPPIKDTLWSADNEILTDVDHVLYVLRHSEDNWGYNYAVRHAKKCRDLCYLPFYGSAKDQVDRLRATLGMRGFDIDRNICRPGYNYEAETTALSSRRRMVNK